MWVMYSYGVIGKDVIIYTLFLVFFGAFSFTSGNNTTDFKASKADVLIVNEDDEKGVTKNLVNYIKKNCNVKKIKNDAEAISDALFYRDVNYIIYIPQGYRRDFINKKNPEITVKSTGDYSASLVETMLKSYLKTAGIYNSKGMSEKDVINNTNKTLDKNVKVKVTSKLDVDNLTNAARYFNFTNYCMLAGCIYVIGVVLASFREDKIRKRTVISGINYKKYNNQLLISNGLFAIVLWLAYVVLGFILIGKIMFSVYGLLFIANLFIFTICVLTLAFFISNLVSKKDALNGIVNVIARGLSFLCGAFVSMQWL